MCERVGEDSGHGIGHVDIQVGSCNCLNVIVCYACALRWGVTHVGNYHYWALLTLSRDHHFRYRERSVRRHSLVVVGEESPVVALAIILYTCIKILRFNICCIKSNVKTLEP